MVTTEQIIEVLKYAENVIIDIQTVPDGFVRGYLLNHVDLRRPYRLIVHPIADKRSMRIWITSIVKTRNSIISGALVRTGTSLTCECAGMDSRDAVSFRYAEDSKFSLAQLILLLDKMFVSIWQFEMIVIFCTMLDSHISRSRVREIMNSSFLKWKDKPTTLSGDTL